MREVRNSIRDVLGLFRPPGAVIPAGQQAYQCPEGRVSQALAEAVTGEARLQNTQNQLALKCLLGYKP